SDMALSKLLACVSSARATDMLAIPAAATVRAIADIFAFFMGGSPDLWRRSNGSARAIKCLDDAFEQERLGAVLPMHFSRKCSGAGHNQTDTAVRPLAT